VIAATRTETTSKPIAVIAIAGLAALQASEWPKLPLIV
jgi:hypothetical protein